MSNIRYTISELKSNIRFLFWVFFCFLITLIAVHFYKMKLVSDQHQVQMNWSTNEAFITRYQNAFYTTHDGQFAITKEYATGISQTFQMFEDPVIQEGPYQEYLEHWKGMLEGILDARSANKDHEHQMCVGLNARLNVEVKNARLEHTERMEKMFGYIQLADVFSLIFIMLTLAMIIYTAIYTTYGGKEKV